VGFVLSATILINRIDTTMGLKTGYRDNPKNTWKKGQSGNPNGRPKGTPNRSTQEIKEFIQQIVSKNLDCLELDLDSMNPFQRWQTLEKISKYFLPTFNKTELSGEIDTDIKITVKYDTDDSDKIE